MTVPFRIVTEPEKARLRVEDFLLLNESGAFADYTRTELIDGEIYGMNAQYSRHARIKSQLARRLGNALETMSSPFDAWTEVSVRLSDTSLPEPDIVLTSYRGTGPVPLETLAMVIEVADTTFETDIGLKAELYARAGVPEYWVVDTQHNCIVMHMEPGADGYAEQIDVPFGEDVFSGTIDGLTVKTEGLA
jgi:Uma2 family endonuclease